ncbi:MAG: GNAT family N-acetyltransferase [Kofleriaceae bacterium]
MKRRSADPIPDFEILYRLRSEGFRDHVLRVFGSWDDTKQRNYLVEDLASTAYDLVEDADGTAIACVAVSVNADHDFIDDLVVATAHRNRGLGAELVRDCQAAARARGVPLRLSVLDGNRAIELYQRLGFRITLVVPPRTKLEWP